MMRRGLRRRRGYTCWCFARGTFTFSLPGVATRLLDCGAAEQLANDIAAQALDHAETDASRILVVFTRQYAWEGYFDSPLLCVRLVRKNSNACSKTARAMFGIAGRLYQGIAAHESGLGIQDLGSV